MVVIGRLRAAPSPDGPQRLNRKVLRMEYSADLGDLAFGTRYPYFPHLLCLTLRRVLSYWGSVEASADQILLALPLGAAAYLLQKVIGLLLKVMEPVAHVLPQGRWFGIAAVEVAAFALLGLVLLFLGLVARSNTGRRVRELLEDVVMSKIPGYLIIKTIAADFATGEGSEDFRPALVSFDDNAVLGFIVEESADTDLFTVFVPGAPGAASGGVVLVSRSRVQPLATPLATARRSLKLRGLGLQKLVSLKRQRADKGDITRASTDAVASDGV
jgi:uncharacterized membrane protein